MHAFWQMLAMLHPEVSWNFHSITLRLGTTVHDAVLPKLAELEQQRMRTSTHTMSSVLTSSSAEEAKQVQ